MAWVSEVSEQEAGPDTRRLYEQIKGGFGFLPNFFRAQGRSPRLIEGELIILGKLLRDGALSQAVKEQILVVVSGLNTSSYCIAIHMENLRKLGVEKRLARQLAVNYASAGVEPRSMALFRFADKLTRQPGEISESDVEDLKAVGWDDAAIYEAALTVALANFVNRISAGLGLLADF